MYNYVELMNSQNKICDQICENPTFSILSMSTCKLTAINIGSSNDCVTKCCSSLTVEL